MRHLVSSAAVLACVIVVMPAGAQRTEEELAAEIEARLNAAPNLDLPPVDTLTCEQMAAEMMVAGQRMTGQLDPSVGVDAQQMLDEAQGGRDEAIARDSAVTAACAVRLPIANPACTAAANARAAEMAAETAENRARMADLQSRILDSTAGIDLARMQALSMRFESENCQAALGAPPG